MSHRIPAIAILLAGAVVLATAQTPRPVRPHRRRRRLTPEARWQSAVDAWEAGRYPAALDDLRLLLKSASGADYFDRVALLTGELYATTVLTTDGRNPKISGNGAFASYETGVADAAVTRVVRIGATPQTIADLQTTSVAFDRSGRRLAWLKGAAGANAAASEIVVRDLTTGTERSILGPGLIKVISHVVW
jgi:hypothetical protein